MKVKYKFSVTWLLMGITWFFLTIYLYFKMIPNSEAYFNIRMLFMVGLPILISIYYFCMPLIQYISSDGKEIRIHLKIIFIKKKIKINELVCIRIKDKDMVFITNKEEFPIHLDWIKKQDAKNLITYFSNYTKIFEGNTNDVIKIVD